MTFTISLGYWIIPLFLNIGFFMTAYLWLTPDARHLGGAIEALFYYGAATIFSLLSWIAYLIWYIYVN